MNYPAPALTDVRRRYSAISFFTLLTAFPLISTANGSIDELVDDVGAEDELIISDVDLDARQSVFVATKTRKTLQEAPAIVTVLTGDEMDAAGFRTLNEALHTVPGFEHSNTSRWDFLFTRGNAFTVSVLVNGVPIVNPGDNLVFLDQAYPVNTIERVEIISGPGGILWGANAYLGVINIVTKKGADIGGLFVEGGAGSFNTGRAAIAYGQKFGDLDVMFFGNFQTTNEGEVNVMRQTTAIPPDFAFPLDDEDPDNPTIYNPGGPPRFQRPGSTDPRADFFVDFIGTLNWRGFSLFTKVAWERDYYQISSSTGALLQDDQSFDKDPATIISLGYATRFFDEAVGLQTRVYLWSQEFQVDSVIFPSLPNSIPNPFILRLAIDNQFRYGANLEIDAKLPLGNTLLAGIEYYRAEISGARLAFFGPNTGNFIDGGELVPDSESNVISVYVNNELNLFERIAVSGGVRFNYSDTYASAFLASANIVGQLLDYDSVQSYLKLSYTQGFRPPSFEQRFSTAPFFLGNQNIGPERSEAFQVELNAKLLRDKGPIRHLTIRADFAHTELKDLIALRDSEDGQSAQFNNLGTRVVDSVEAALDLRFKRGHQMWATYSFNQVRDTTAQIDIRNNAPHIINVGGLVRLNKHLAFNARLSWVDAKQIRDYLDPDTLQTRALTIDAYTLLSAGVVISDAEQRYRLLIHAYNMLGYQYETVDGDTVAAPYPYQQPNRVALLSRFQATF